MNRTLRLRLRDLTRALAVLPLCFSHAALALAPFDLNLITDAALKSCVTTQVNERGWKNDEEVNFLTCNQMGIASTAGLAQFTRMQSLELVNNNIASIDLAPFKDLEHLNLTQNRLTAIDVRSLTKLRSLFLHSNQLASVDVASNVQLESLSVSSNRLTSVNVANNTKLTFLHVGQNQLTQLDVSRNTALTSLNAGTNALTAVDVSKNTALKYLGIGNNPLTAATLSYLGGISGVAGLVVDMDGREIASAVFPGTVTGSLKRTTIPENSSDMVMFTVAANGTYNFRIDERNNTGSTALLVTLKDEAGATLNTNLMLLPGPNLLQHTLRANQQYSLEIRMLDRPFALDYTLAVSQAQQHTISGRVIDFDGNPVRGAKVVVGVNQSLLGKATTNRNGVYTITAFGAPLVNVFIDDNFDRFPQYFYAGSADGLAAGRYDNALAGFIAATDLDFTSRDLRNINLQVATTAIEGKLDLNKVSVAQTESLALHLRTLDNEQYIGIDTSGGLTGVVDYQHIQLVPNSRYEIRARLFSSSSLPVGVETYKKVFPTFLRTDANGKIAPFNFVLPEGSFQFDPSLSPSYGFASSTADLREDGSFASSTLVSADRSFVDSLGVDSSADAEDYYVFSVTESGRYDFAVDVATTSAVFRLELFDAQQTRVFSVSGNLGAGATPELSRTLAPGQYYLKLSAVSGSSAYTLHLEPGIRNITLKPGFYINDEQNSDLDKKVNPVDQYKFRAQSSGLYHFGILFDSSKVQAKLVLRDANQNVINAGNELNFIAQTLTAGVDYIVEVKADSGAGDYLLGIEPDSSRQAGSYLPQRGIALPQ